MNICMLQACLKVVVHGQEASKLLLVIMHLSCVHKWLTMLTGLSTARHHQQHKPMF